MTARARHISIRVPWHDMAWNGTVCHDPEANCHCIEYENIARGKDVSVEIARKGMPFTDFDRPSELPPCANESGGFLSPNEWTRSHEHPYREWLRETHGHLEETAWQVEPYTAHAVPFRWLDRDSLEEFTQPQVADALPQDTWPSSYKSKWVFQPHVQQAILEAFFAPIVPNDSLAFFYTKSRQPIFEDVHRLIVGVGAVVAVGKERSYRNTTKPDAPDHPIWERDIAHSLRPGGHGGLLVPYHEYLVSTGDLGEDRRRRELSRELRISPENGHAIEFSYRSEHVADDVAVSVLTQAIRVVQLIREHGIARGDWAGCEDWLDAKLAQAWTLRGQYPGIGPVLRAAGLPMASSLVHSLDSTDPGFRDAPWRAVRRVLDGSVEPPHERYEREIDAFAREWLHLCNRPEKLKLAEALSRVALDNEQAARWWDETKRAQTVARPIRDEEIIENLYLLSEYDAGSLSSAPITFAAVDRALLGDTSGANSEVSTADTRRMRAAIVAVLREAEIAGDTLLGFDDIREATQALSVSAPVTIGPDWMPAHAEELTGLVSVHSDDGWAQLTRRAVMVDQLRRKLSARARRELHQVDEDWLPLLEQSIRVKSNLDLMRATQPKRVDSALSEQVHALKVIVSRKLTVLVGRAGTGKTTVLGALSRSSKIGGAVLFLAPTGKARVRLSRNVEEGNSVQTVAQYLLSQRAYDTGTQQPIILQDGTYDAHRTVVIDESSMLTEETLLAVLSTFSPNVDRLILVGDTAQLPPIGAGRPFSDLVAHLSGEIVFDDDEEDTLDKVSHRQGAHARLSVEVRNHQGEDSDTLRFAKLFSGDPLPANAEAVIGDLLTKSTLNDLEVRYWQTEQDLQEVLRHVLKEKLDLLPGDTDRFNRLLGIHSDGKYWNVTVPDLAENWQILSPVRGDKWGVAELNRWVQRTWRGKQLDACRTNSRWTNPFGPNEIIRLDKVLLTRNLRTKRGYNFQTQQRVEEYLANGDIGLCSNDRRAKATPGRGSVMDIMFAGRPGVHFGFLRRDFGDDKGDGDFDLAYALTIHKAQGSDFNTVIVVLPRHTRISSRELLYTALTRSRDDLVLLVEGSDLSTVLNLANVTASDTIKRNSNLFRASVRGQDEKRWATHLIHRASNGIPVRSKSELKIMDDCLAAGLRPRYEQRLESASGDGTFKLPDFTFVTDAGDPVIWEHLGMLDLKIYAGDWKRKLQWYEQNGFKEEQTLFTTSEVGGLQSKDIAETIRKVRAAIESY
ncbi:MAG: AAA family ATPase [Acidimicrobiaceae bacterium]|nr:AAA family ATPase [Acidimicrobiaceae bacterium]MYF34473.1 AAA family ATPase [Acidimicrobiaceae bacterium]